MKPKALNKTLIYTGIFILLAGILIVLLQRKENSPEISIASELSSSLSPTPDPLSTLAFDLTPSSKIIREATVTKSSQRIEPSQIKKEGQQQAENEYFDLYSINNYLPVNIKWWQQESRRIYEYDSKRLNTTINGKVTVIFVPPESGSCPTRGLAFREEPVIEIFADKNTSEAQIRAVLAHELGHLLTFQKYRNLDDVALSEGMATWVAGDFWKEWKGFDFNSGVKTFINKRIYLPLVENYDLEKTHDSKAPDCIAHRDILYTELASFIDYLIRTYGMERLATLFDMRKPENINNKRVIYPPDYKDVYGLELNQLEYEWLKTLLGPRP